MNDDNNKNGADSKQPHMRNNKMLVSGSVHQKHSLSEQARKLTIPIEKYVGYRSPAELEAYAKYQRSQFPDLFVIKGLENDKGSEVPFLALSNATRLLANLMEANMLEQANAAKNKEIN